MNIVHLTVEGLNCDHCVASVTEEIEEIEGVRSVVVELLTGHAVVVSDHPLDERDLCDAIELAGYRLLSPVPC